MLFSPMTSPRFRKFFRSWTGFFSILLLFPLLTGCYPKQDAGQSTAAAPIPVRLAKVETKDVQISYFTTGRTDVNPINIVPRVRGYIEEVCFTPGDIVDEGDVLYRIESFDYKNAVDVAQANCDVAKAQATKSKADYDRQISLQEQGKGFTTQADVDQAKAHWDESRANIVQMNSNLEMAKKNLERTVITAPCRGKIGRSKVDPGNLVDGSAGTPAPLTTIMPMDPMYVYFELPDVIFTNFTRDITEKIKKVLGDKFDFATPHADQEYSQVLKENGIDLAIQFEMGLTADPDGVYPYTGSIDFLENNVDLNTGTITLRGRIDNPNYTIYPGSICKVKIPGKTTPNAILVQEKAICYDLSDVYLWVLDENGKPQKRNVTLGEQYGQQERIITSGLTGNETYILDGTQNVRGGCDIVEVPADNSDGKTSTDNSNETVPASPTQETTSETTSGQAAETPAENAPASDAPATPPQQDASGDAPSGNNESDDANGKAAPSLRVKQ